LRNVQPSRKCTTPAAEQHREVLGRDGHGEQGDGRDDEVDEGRDVRVLDVDQRAPVEALEEPEPDARGHGPESRRHAGVVVLTDPPK
jgi:hypothetical protein